MQLEMQWEQCVAVTRDHSMDEWVKFTKFTRKQGNFALEIGLLDSTHCSSRRRENVWCTFTSFFHSLMNETLLLYTRGRVKWHLSLIPAVLRDEMNPTECIKCLCARATEMGKKKKKFFCSSHGARDQRYGCLCDKSQLGKGGGEKKRERERESVSMCLCLIVNSRWMQEWVYLYVR